MHQWSLLFLSIGLAAGSFNPSPNQNLHHSEGPARPAAFTGTDGELVIIEAGDVGLYETGMFDDLIDYKEDVKFFLFTKNNPSVGQQLYLNDLDSINESNFNSSKLTKFVIHGFVNNLKSEMVQMTKDAFLENYDFNVVAVDWGALADNIFYPIVVSEVPGVGKYVGEFIEFLVANASVDPTQVHLVGHSLGAHVSGFAGKRTQSQAGFNVSRISGLDPALPGYAFDSSKSRLAKTDADYVDCIHTTSGFVGFASPICQGDFYPNGGLDSQPGCPLIDFGSCSHMMAYKFYDSSINETNVFSAETCKAILLGIPFSCSSRGALMGYPADAEKDLGSFYLKTSTNYPYTKN